MFGKMIGIGGEPATGKTTLMKKLMERLNPFDPFKDGLIQGHRCRANPFLEIWGVYEEGQLFAGTDRLSMAVQPDAKRLLDAKINGTKMFSIAWEGDRLFNRSWLEFCWSKMPFLKSRVFILTATEGELQKRRQGRPGQQNPQWVAGRKTKLRKIAEDFPGKVCLVQLQNESSMILLLDDIQEFLCS